MSACSISTAQSSGIYLQTIISKSKRGMGCCPGAPGWQPPVSRHRRQPDLVADQGLRHRRRARLPQGRPEHQLHRNPLHRHLRRFQCCERLWRFGEPLLAQRSSPRAAHLLIGSLGRSARPRRKSAGVFLLSTRIIDRRWSAARRYESRHKKNIVGHMFSSLNSARLQRRSPSYLTHG